MGLFSVLDVVLERPMKEVVEMISVAKPIANALVNGEGEMAEVYEFIKAYEDASFQEVSRRMLLANIEMNDVYEAYLASLSWYRDLINL